MRKTTYKAEVLSQLNDKWNGNLRITFRAMRFFKRDEKKRPKYYIFRVLSLGIM